MNLILLDDEFRPRAALYKGYLNSNKSIQVLLLKGHIYISCTAADEIGYTWKPCGSNLVKARCGNLNLWNRLV